MEMAVASAIRRPPDHWQTYGRQYLCFFTCKGRCLCLGLGGKMGENLKMLHCSGQLSVERHYGGANSSFLDDVLSWVGSL